MDLIFAQYEERLIRRRRDPQTLRLFRYAAKRFEAGLGELGTTATEAEPYQVEEFFAGLELGHHTQRSILQHVRSAYRYAHRRGVVSLDPTYDVELGRPPEKDPVVIPARELRDIQRACRHEDDLLRFFLFTYTGMRRAEVAGLTWDKVNLSTGLLSVMGKGAKLRRVPIHPALHELLLERRYHFGQPIIRWVHWDWLRIVAPGRSFHDFRRTAATSLRKNGVQTQVIDRIFGWAPRGIMGRYYDYVADEEMSEAILRLYVDDPL